MICGYIVGWSEQGLTQYTKWWETHQWELAYDKYFNVYAPILNKEYLNKFPEYKYSAVMQYPYGNIFKYLRFYEQYPQVEMLVKFGLYPYATSKSQEKWRTTKVFASGLPPIETNYKEDPFT